MYVGHAVANNADKYIHKRIRQQIDLPQQIHKGNAKDRKQRQHDQATKNHWTKAIIKKAHLVVGCDVVGSLSNAE